MLLDKINLCFLLTLFVLTNSYAQSEKISIDYSMRVNQGIQKELSASLEFKDGVSIYKWNNTENKSETSQDDFGNSKFYVDVTDSIGTVNMVNYHTDSIYSRSLRFKNSIVLVEKKPQFDWKITDETKKIGEFTVQKATTQFRGRNYEAWFTPEIPIKIGPWKLNGLPGLILEAYDLDGIVHFNFQKAKTSDKALAYNAEIFDDGKIVGVEEFEQLQNDLADDMLRKIMAKMPRGTSISIDQKTETFLEKEYK
uniref:GLPGLI family protein n=1 Tax=uncultured Christiangramia sp. TaxID=503836 RepID=UPI00261F1648|nr:GLPGLI family protein [uncultured Christiangramia sp.]